MKRYFSIIKLIIPVLIIMVSGLFSVQTVAEELPRALIRIKKISTLRPYHEITSAQISADGSGVVYVSSAYIAGNPSAVVALNPDGGGEKILFTSHKEKNPHMPGFVLSLSGKASISGDGKTIAFPAACHMPNDLIHKTNPAYMVYYHYNNGWLGPYVIKLDKFCEKNYMVYKIESPTISEDGTKIVFRAKFTNWWEDKSYYRLMLYDRKNNQPKSLLRYNIGGKYHSDFAPLISGNGEKIIFAGNDSDSHDMVTALFTINSKGGELMKMSPVARAVSADYQVSYDGTKTAFFYYGDPKGHYIVDDSKIPSGRTEITHVDKSPLIYGAYTLPQMSPDGKKVFYCFYNEMDKSYAFYRKNSDNTGDEIVLDGSTPDLPLVYDVISPGSSGPFFNMDSRGSKFLAIKYVNEKGHDLYVIEILEGKKVLPVEQNLEDMLGKPCATDEEFVNYIYYSVLESKPDSKVVEYFVNGMKSEMSKGDVIIEFFNSPPYRQADKSDLQFIRDLFQSILGREPGFSDLDSWSTNLSKEKNRGMIVHLILKSEMYLTLMKKCKNK